MGKTRKSPDKSLFSGTKRDPHGRWKPGISGNRGGRPKRNIAEKLRVFLDEPYDEGNIDRAQHLINVLYKLATEGAGIAAARLLLSYSYGNPPQQMQLETTEIPYEERQAAAFITYLEEHPRTASSNRRYLLLLRKEGLEEDDDES